MLTLSALGLWTLSIMPWTQGDVVVQTHGLQPCGQVDEILLFQV